MPDARVIRRAALALLALTVVAGIAAPFIRADRFREPIRQSLERSLGRRVKVGDVRLNVFSGPGFTIENVLIYENPAYGVEPFAHVLTLDARVGLGSLWRRRLEFSALRLTEPSLNLVRRSEGGWNLVPLLEESLSAQQAAGVPLPYIEVRAGKLFFKTDDTKSTFYLTNTDVNVWPRSGGRDGFDVRFTTEPARSDRRAHGFASLSGRGRWTPPGRTNSSLNLELTLARTGMEEIARLLRGHAFGVHGFLTSTAQVSGPVSNLRIAGRLRIDDVHRWDLLPARGGIDLSYTGRFDWSAKRATMKLADRSLPVTTTLYLDNFIEQPVWRAEFDVAQLPVRNLLEVARHLGVSFPSELDIEGQMSGTATLDGRGWNGTLDIGQSRLSLGPSTRFEFEPSQVLLAGQTIRLAPTAVTGDGGQSAEIAAEYDRERDVAGLHIRAQALSIAEVQSGAGHIFREAAVPLIERVRRGTWTGSLHYTAALGLPGTWAGQFDLRDVLADVPGLSEAVRIRSASVTLQGDRAVLHRMRGRAGKLDLFGEYRYEPSAKRPHRFNVAVPQADLAELERLFLPSLRREQSFLARTLRWRAAPPPAWLRERQAEGTLRIGALTAGELTFRGVRALVVWDGTQLTLTSRDAKFDDGVIRASASADLSAPLPRYRIETAVRGLSFRTGRIDLDGVSTTRGVGADALLNFRSQGTFEGEALAVLPDNPVHTASGTYELTISRTGPLIRLTDLQAALGAETFSGEAATLADGTLRVDLASARRSMRFTGPLMPLRLEAAARP